MTDAALPAQRIEGIGGWLLLPVLHLSLDVAVLLLFVGLGLFGHPVFRMAPPGFGEVLLNGYLLALLLVGVFAVFCMNALFQKRRELPGMMPWFYLVVIAKSAWGLALVWIYPELQSPLMSMANAVRDMASSVIVAAIWIPYFRVSIRVANTFKT